MAAVLACGPDAVLSHRSAGQLWGLVPRSPIGPEVDAAAQSFGGGRHPAAPFVLPADEVEVVDGIPVTSAPRTLFDLAAVLTPREMERALNEVEVRRLTRPALAAGPARALSGAAGRATLRELLGDQAPGGITRNDFEEASSACSTRTGCRGRGSTRHRPARAVLRGRLPLGGAAADRRARRSRRRTGPTRAFETDRERDRILLAEGWRVARVTWRQLRDDPRRSRAT